MARSPAGRAIGRRRRREWTTRRQPPARRRTFASDHGPQMPTPLPLTRGALRSVIRRLEVPPDAELDDPTLDDRRRAEPGAAVDAGVTRSQGEDRVGVERVVHVEVRIERALADLEDLA